MSLKIAHDVKEKDRTEDIQIKENVDFSAMLLSENVLCGLKKCGYQKPSPIQLKAIPLGRCGFDLIVKAKSGTGKTAVFVITALEMIDLNKNHAQVVILAPTREIAVQIQQVIKHVGCEFHSLGVEYFIGGTPMSEDEVKLQNCHIIVGAPGRVKHLIEKKLLDVSQVRLFILDEADKLMEPSFKQSINWIYNHLPKRKQVMAISATYPDNLDKFLANYMLSPTHVSPDTKMPMLLGLRQFYTVVNHHLNTIQQMKFKTEKLTKILANLSFNQCLVFSNYQTRAESLSNNLNQKGWPSRFISGQQSQMKRLEAVDDLKRFKCRILSSTDLTARGIDAANVDLVVNYDVPIDVETYLHRMGRAGRYGSYGICITIASEGKELRSLQKIIKQLGNNVAIAKLPDAKHYKDIWHCDFNNLEHLHCSDDEDEASIKETKRLAAGRAPTPSDRSMEITSTTLNEVSNIICRDYNSKVCDLDVKNVGDILKSINSQPSEQHEFPELNNDLLKKLSTGNLHDKPSVPKKHEEESPNRKSKIPNRKTNSSNRKTNEEKVCVKQGDIDLTRNKQKGANFEPNEAFTLDPRQNESKRSRIEDGAFVFDESVKTFDGRVKTFDENTLESIKSDSSQIDHFVDHKPYLFGSSCEESTRNENVQTRAGMDPFNIVQEVCYAPIEDISNKMTVDDDYNTEKTLITLQTQEKSYENLQNEDGESPNNNKMATEMTSQETKTNKKIQESSCSYHFTPHQIEDTPPNSLQNVQKRSKIDKMVSVSQVTQSERQETSSNLNNLLQKNIALFKLTKLVMENKFCASLIKDCSKEVSTLLESVNKEDELQCKSYTDDDISSFLAQNSLSGDVSRPIIIEDHPKTPKKLCECPEHLFSLVYDRVIHTASTINVKSIFCDRHSFNRPIIKEEFNCDNFCADSTSLMDIEDESILPPPIQEDLFTNAFDKAIKGKVQTYTESHDVPDTSNKSFISLRKQDISIPSIKEAYVSPELQSFVERRNVYTSYYQHYSNVLAETATSFTDVNEFHEWFSKWREEVEAVRDFVQQDIYEHECNKNQL